jgi:phosphatidylserine/phosphatidylglycerophosphate/cardiolipin synthase-like enzyme
MPAIAFSNNDIAVVAWTFDKHLDGCLGFAVIQIDSSGKETPLRALASFAGQPKDPTRTTEQAPVQKFWWKDLFAKRGGTYKYRIVPMGGTPGQTLTPLAGIAPLISNSVALTEKRPPFNVYFNRGIVATQALSRELNDHPSVPALTPHIQDPSDPIRINLMGQLFEGVTSLLDRADKNGGTIHGALYELNDPKGLEKRLQANPTSRSVILGNEQGVDKAKKPIADMDAANRAALKAAGVKVIDRILGKGSIPHNKFLVLSENGAPTAVLSGSTNWTSTGLCTQTNNALVIESKDVAQRYISYWNALQADITAAGGDQKKLQSPTLRGFDHSTNDGAINKPIDLGGGVSVEVMFSPNTNHPLKSPPTEVPNDMKRVFDLINGAKQAVLFLAFDPGNNSILDAAGKALANNPDLFVRGALTSAQRASNFSEALHQGGGADHGGDADQAAASAPEVTVVGEPGQPKKKGAKLPSAAPDFRAVPAGAVNDAFGNWEKELAKYGFAIIHNKIVVIDPFSDNCTVVTGSHNLGYRASHNNDENMVIIRGHRALAEAYACHVLDIYDHYAWRFLLKQHPDIFGKPLEPDDKWQERYISGPDLKSPELRFWLAAATGSKASSPAKPPSPQSASPPAPNEKGKKKPGKTAANKKPAKKAAAAKKTAKKTSKQTSSKKKGAKKAANKAPKKVTKKAARKTAKKTAEKKSTSKKAGKKR